MNLRISFLFILISVFMICTSGFGVVYVEAERLSAPCDVQDPHHYLKLTANPLECEKVDYWVPDECGYIAGLYKTESRCQPPSPGAPKSLAEKNWDEEQLQKAKAQEAIEEKSQWKAEAAQRAIEERERLLAEAEQRATPEYQKELEEYASWRSGDDHRTPTVLKLNNLPSSFELKGQNESATVTFSGRLLTENGDPVENAKIELKNSTGMNYLVLVTDSRGMFIGTVLPSTAGSYTVQAVYNGAGNHIDPVTNSKSQTIAFSVEHSSSPSPSAPGSNLGAIIGAIIVGIFIIVTLVIIAKRIIKRIMKRKTKRKRPPPPPPPQIIEGPKKTHRYACPKCQKKLQRNFQGQKCKCGWRSSH